MANQSKRNNGIYFLRIYKGLKNVIFESFNLSLHGMIISILKILLKFGNPFDFHTGLVALGPLGLVVPS